jgi:hypothetical protein
VSDVPPVLKAILELLTYKNDCYLDEIQAHLYEYFDLQVSITALSRNLKRNGWRKKAMRIVA